MKVEEGLTALVALDGDIFDGQHTPLPRGNHFKHNLKEEEEEEEDA